MCVGDLIEHTRNPHMSPSMPEGEETLLKVEKVRTRLRCSNEVTGNSECERETGFLTCT